MSYDVSADVDIAYIYFEDCHIESSGTVTLKNGELSSYFNNGQTKIRIPIELPEGYYGSGGVDDKNTDLNLVVDLTKGIQSAYFDSVNKHYD